MKKNTELSVEEIRADFLEVLKLYGIKEKDVEAILKSENVQNSIIDAIGQEEDGDKWYIADSKIHGKGIFAKKNIKKDEVIQKIDITKGEGQWFGRRLNHHPIPNCGFKAEEEMVFIAEALVDIEKDKEIFNNYRKIV